MDEITPDTAPLRAVEQSRDKMGRARVKPSLRAQLIAHVKQRVAAGDARGRIAQELGLGIGTIHAWLSPRGDRRRPAKKSKTVRRVEIVEASTESRLVVHARHDVRVEGLTLAQVAELLRAL